MDGANVELNLESIDGGLSDSTSTASSPTNRDFSKFVDPKIVEEGKRIQADLSRQSQEYSNLRKSLQRLTKMNKKF